MPLAKDPEIVPKPPEATITPITPTDGQRADGAFKYAVVDVRKRSVDTLLANVEGSKWKINYYRQLLTDKMEPTGYQENQLIPYQQYESIFNYPLIVTNPLTTSQNEETLLFEVTGSGILSFAIIPNIKDIFTADIGDGRLGVLSVEKIVRKTILSDSVYEIEYTLLDYLTNETDDILKQRSVRDLYYCSDKLGSGRGPLLSLEQLSEYRFVKSFIEYLFKFYNERFTDKDNCVLLIPHIEKIYDPYISKFWDKITLKTDYNYQLYPRVLVVDDIWDNKKTILDSLLNQDSNLEYIHDKCKLINSNDVFIELIYNSVSVTNIEKILVLEDINTSVPQLEDNIKRVDFYPVKNENSYIFSKALYTKNYTLMSKIELLVMDYLNGEYLKVKQYIELLNIIENMADLEKFYYIPILLCIGLKYLRVEN